MKLRVRVTNNLKKPVKLENLGLRLEPKPPAISFQLDTV